MLCPSCSNPSIFHDHGRGEFVCTSCGLVIFDRVLEPGPERYVKPGEKGARADLASGLDYSVHDLGVGSDFRVPLRTAPSKRAELRRMHFLHKTSRVTEWRERSLREALLEVDKVCEYLSIPKGVKLEVCTLYRRMKSRGLGHGRNAHLLAVATTFLVCRARGLPRTEVEAVRVLVDRYGFEKQRAVKNLHRVIKFLSEKLGLEPRRISAKEYIDRFSIQLGLGQEEIRAAHRLYSKVFRFTKSKSPRLVAAALIYLAAESQGELVALRRISEVIGVGLSSLSRGVKFYRGLLAREG
jgi:transcription initiation factor TFIIB